jgi:hypothetical protein
MNISDVSKNLFLTETDLSVDISFAAGCKFWKTKYENIYITDYNLGWSCFDDDDTDFDEDLKTANLLKSKDLATIFYNKKGRFIKSYISGLVLQNTDLALKAIDDFYLETISK